MKQHKLFSIILLLSCLSVTAYSKSGYEIKIKVSGLKDSTVVLAHYFAKESLTFIKDDSTKLNKKGEAIFANTKPLTGGMYIVILPQKKYFDLFIGNNQQFSVEADTADLVRNVKFKGSEENSLFYNYRSLITGKTKEMKHLNEQFASANPAQKDSITKARNSLNTEVKNYIRQSIDQNKGTFFATWLQALQEVEIPPLPRDAKGNITDPNFQYKYWHQHFFDNFDLSDVKLLHTPFYERKVIDYLDKAAIQHPDSIQKETDRLMSMIGSNDEVRRYMLGTIYNHLAEKANQYVGMDSPFVYFAEKYYLPQATWADQKFRDNLQKDIAKIKPNLLGKEAPNLPLAEIPVEHFITSKTDTVARKSLQIGRMMKLQDVRAKFTVLVFWEVDCGHCQKEMPLLYDSIYPIIKNKDVKIVAIHMLTGADAKAKWVDFVNDHKLYDWINATPLEYAYKDTYNIISTPTVYLLDENKRILSKRIGIKQLPEVIENEIKRQQAQQSSH
jgi:thiol-disulfide isomerase/thioredoxin